MQYETEEQQIEALKTWWEENGRAVIAGVVLGAGLIGGWALWKDYAEKKIVAASDGFSRIIEAVDGAELDTALNLADEVQDDSPGHLYASYAALAAARAAVENNDLEEAGRRLEWVVEHAPQDDIRLVATVRLARVTGATGDAAAALALLPDSFPEAFTGLVEEARGDLAVLANDPQTAREAYRAALASEFVANPEGLTMKLNELAQPGDSDDDNSESTS